MSVSWRVGAVGPPGRRKLVTAALVVAALLGFSAPTFAQWNIGDVFASIGSGLVRVYDGTTGAAKADLNAGGSGFTTGGAFDDDGNFYVTNFSLGRVYVFDPTGAPIGDWATGGSSPESIVFNIAGDLYIGHAFGDRDVRKFSTAGAPQGSYNVATSVVGSDWIDLSIDQKTLFYTSEGSEIFRYDLSTNTQLPNFANGLPGGNAFALRLLGSFDGSDGLLVADRAAIYRLNGAGNIVQTYDFAGHDNWFALNLDPDGTSFWSGDFVTGQLHRFDIATGAVLKSIVTGSSSLYGVTVFGEITGGTGGGGGSVTPEPVSMVLLATGLLGIGATRRRRRDSTG